MAWVVKKLLRADKSPSLPPELTVAARRELRGVEEGVESVSNVEAVGVEEEGPLEATG